jgi:hypothetical protein
MEKGRGSKGSENFQGRIITNCPGWASRAISLDRKLSRNTSGVMDSIFCMGISWKNINTLKTLTGSTGLTYFLVNPAELKSLQSLVQSCKSPWVTITTPKTTTYFGHQIVFLALIRNTNSSDPEGLFDFNLIPATS